MCTINPIINTILSQRLARITTYKYTPFRNYAEKKRKLKRNLEETKVDIPKNQMKYITAPEQKENGFPYDKKPFKMFLEKDKTYTWCLCGLSHTQPICDATHRFYMWNIKLRPIRFRVAETKEYWLCNCKQTKNRPFCDGSHRNPDIIATCENKFVCTG